MMKFKTWSYLLVISWLLCTVLSCKDNNDAPDAVPQAGQVAFFNLVPGQGALDFGAIDFYVNGTRQNTNKLVYADYSGYLSIPSGQAAVEFKSDSLREQIFLSPQFMIHTDSSTIFVTGKKNAVTAIVTRDTALADTGNIKPKLRFVHASADSPVFDVILTSKNSRVSIPNQAYKSISPFVMPDTGKVTLTFNLAGTNTAIPNLPNTIVLQPSHIYTLFIYGSYTGSGGNGLNLGIIANR
jgi:hypothetical protein